MVSIWHVDNVHKNEIPVWQCFSVSCASGSLPLPRIYRPTGWMPLEITKVKALSDWLYWPRHLPSKFWSFDSMRIEMTKKIQKWEKRKFSPIEVKISVIFGRPTRSPKALRDPRRDLCTLPCLIQFLSFPWIFLARVLPNNRLANPYLGMAYPLFLESPLHRSFI